MKKKEIYFGKGLKRIYFTIAGLWLCIPLGAILTGNVVKDDPNTLFNTGLTWTDIWQMIALPFVIYFVLLFIIKGFRK
tara:strand:- start:216 stop:449 length:234 start_codon:yes stop_codon:yes gene_type:complete